MAMLQKIIPNLWFDGNAKEAAEFYVSVFPDSRIVEILNYPMEGLADFQKPLAGKPLTIEFELAGQHYIAINADSEFKFNESVSFMITCKDQEEIDYYWEKLSSDPSAEVCGWCKDKYGLSWQVTGENIDQQVQNPENFAKMMQMKKIILADFV